MKHVAIVVSILVLFLVFGVNYANAQPADQGENVMMQDDPMGAGTGMMADDHQCNMGKMSYMREMGGMGMAHGCGCGMMGGRMMGGRMMGDGMMEMPHMGMMPEDIMEARHHITGLLLRLDLDEKQQTATHQIIDRTAKDLIKKRSDLLIAKIELEDIFHKDPLDMNAAESKLKQIEAIKTDMFLTHLKAFEEIKSTLTPEQKKKLTEMMKEHMMGGMGKAEGCRCGMTEEKETHHHEEKGKK